MLDTVAGPLINALLSVMVGMVLWGVKNIKATLKTMNGRVSEHVEDKNLHYAAQARMEEQIKNLLNTVTIAHERIDSIKGRG